MANPGESTTEATVLETLGMVSTDEERIQELVTRGVAMGRLAVDSASAQAEGGLEPLIFPSQAELVDSLRDGRRLTAYLGIDPTAPELHLGHVSQLHKLRLLQGMGHEAILLIGDFTGMIGDPTDKSATRVRLTRDDVLRNAAEYRRLAGKIINFDHPTNPARLVYNSEWLANLTFAELVELASEVTVQQLLERDMFRRRMREGKPLYLHELLYPIMQGWDSTQVAPGGVDIEIGGSDQVFNMLVGSGYVKRHGGKQKFVVAGALLVDPTGKKIGKTEGNMVAVSDNPLDMFHKIMLWSDAIVPHALELCTRMPMPDIADVRRRLEAGELSGLEGKKLLARTVVSELHSTEAAELAETRYGQLTGRSEGLDPAEFATTDVRQGEEIVGVLVRAGLAKSKNDARRLVMGGGVYVNGERVGPDWVVPGDSGGLVLRRGKKTTANHRWLRVDPSPDD